MTWNLTLRPTFISTLVFARGTSRSRSSNFVVSYCKLCCLKGSKSSGMLIHRAFLASGFYLAMMLSHKVSAEKSIKLSSGWDMPSVGLGTYKIPLESMDEVINVALQNGYRHIDTATDYENEQAIGNSLKKWFAKGGKREDLFITTKLPVYGNRAEDVEKFLTLSLKNLGMDYVDMYLIHMPFSFIPDPNKLTSAENEDGSVVLDLQTNHLSTWKEMEKQVEKGRAKSIGLSNFNETQILDVWNNAKIKPSNLQVECHAFLQQKLLHDFCKQRNIALTAYSPLGSPGNKFVPNLFNIFELDPVKKIAADRNKTSAQILLRHLVQKGINVIPKSANPERIEQNIEIFDFNLSDEEMEILNDLGRETHERRFDFSFWKGAEKHPYYPFPGELKPKTTRE